jgi:hypothetical protein
VTRARALLLFVLVVSLLASGCDFADKRRLADRIREAPDLVDMSRTATGELQLSFKIVASSARAGGVQGVKQGQDMPPLVIPTLLDYHGRRAATSLALGPGTQPFQLSVGTALYQHAIQTSATSAVRRQRTWRRLDLDDLYADRTRSKATAVGAPLVSPMTVVDLLRGALTGSVKADGTEAVRGVATHRFRVNVDLDKAYKHEPDARRRAFEVVRELTGMKRVVHPARVWLDAKGLPRRIEVRLREERSRRDATEVILRLELFDFTKPLAIALPKTSDVASVSDLPALGAVLDPSIIAGAAFARGNAGATPTTTTVAP